jgi:hypothetical protein
MQNAYCLNCHALYMPYRGNFTQLTALSVLLGWIIERFMVDHLIAEIYAKEHRCTARTGCPAALAFTRERGESKGILPQL